jgi:hypothetical protein
MSALRSLLTLQSNETHVGPSTTALKTDFPPSPITPERTLAVPFVNLLLSENHEASPELEKLNPA